MTGLRRFERPVVVQVGRRSSERIVFDVNEAAAILLRDLHGQTENRKVAMDACLQVLVVWLIHQLLEELSWQPRSKQRSCAATNAGTLAQGFVHLRVATVIAQPMSTV